MAMREKGARAGVDKLSAIVTLHGFDTGAKLSSYICKEIRNCREHVRLHAKRKRLQKKRAVIQNDQIVFVT